MKCVLPVSPCICSEQLNTRNFSDHLKQREIQTKVQNESKFNTINSFTKPGTRSRLQSADCHVCYCRNHSTTWFMSSNALPSTRPPTEIKPPLCAPTRHPVHSRANLSHSVAKLELNLETISSQSYATRKYSFSSDTVSKMHPFTSFSSTDDL